MKARCFWLFFGVFLFLAAPTAFGQFDFGKAVGNQLQQGINQFKGQVKGAIQHGIQHGLPHVNPPQNGGHQGGNQGGHQGGNHGGNPGGHQGGNHGGNQGGHQGGNHGGNQGGHQGGNHGGNQGGHQGGHPIQPPCPNPPICVDPPVTTYPYPYPGPVYGAPGPIYTNPIVTDPAAPIQQPAQPGDPTCGNGTEPSITPVDPPEEKPELPVVEAGQLVSIDGSGFGEQTGAVFVKIGEMVLTPRRSPGATPTSRLASRNFRWSSPPKR